MSKRRLRKSCSSVYLLFLYFKTMTSKNHLPKFVRHQQSEGTWLLGAAVWRRGRLGAFWARHFD